MKLFCIIPGCNRDRHGTTDFCVVHQGNWEVTPLGSGSVYLSGCNSGGTTGTLKTFDAFTAAVRELMAHKGQSTNDVGADADNQVFKFTQQFCPGASGGEIIYKVIRFQKKHDPMDLLKIAAWAFLEWKHGHGKTTT